MTSNAWATSRKERWWYIAKRFSSTVHSTGRAASTVLLTALEQRTVLDLAARSQTLTVERAESCLVGAALDWGARTRGIGPHPLDRKPLIGRRA